MSACKLFAKEGQLIWKALEGELRICLGSAPAPSRSSLRGWQGGRVVAGWCRALFFAPSSSAARTFAPQTPTHNYFQFRRALSIPLLNKSLVWHHHPIKSSRTQSSVSSSSSAEVTTCNLRSTTLCDSQIISLVSVSCLFFLSLLTAIRKSAHHQDLAFLALSLYKALTVGNVWPSLFIFQKRATAVFVCVANSFCKKIIAFLFW